MSDEKITWTTGRRRVADLLPASYNPRMITEVEREQLKESMTLYGEVEPLVINANNTIIGGHQRASIYMDLGIEKVEVRIPNRQLTVQEEMRLNLRLNKNTGEWDKEKLSDMDLDMLLEVGFGDDELSDIWDNVETLDDGLDLQKAVEEAKTTTVVAGDIYQLGDHRVMCGDSTLHTDVLKVLAGLEVDMIYSDPPYNIGLDYDKGVGNNEGHYGGEHTAKIDSKSDADYATFIRTTLQNGLAYTKKDAHVFYWCDERYIWMTQTMYTELGVANRRVCLWIKNNASPTPQVAFNKAYEPCVYGTRGSPYLNPNYRAFNEVMNKEVGTGNQLADDILDLIDIWLVKRDTTQDYEHPTQKPITLHEKPLRRCTAPGDNVLDLFGGSGSTLMACEQLNRKAFLIEKDPIFVQVILNRYAKHTGREAVKVS